MKVLVIGAGVGGATAGALLAKAGHDVTVLEAHVYPGGCAGTFYHQGYRFDAGATLAGGFHAGGPHDVVGRMLDIQWRTHPVEPAWQVRLPDRVITRWGNANQWESELSSAFGNSRNISRILSFDRELRHVSDRVWEFAARRPAWPVGSVQDLLKTSFALRPRTLTVLPHLLQNVGQWADTYGLTDLSYRLFLDAQLLISAQTTASYASALFGAAAFDLPRKGVNHVEGGIGTIARQLVDAIKRYGGQVHYHQEVVRLEVEHGRVVAAHTNKGQRFECDYCIANLTPWDMARILDGAAPAALKNDVGHRPEEWGAFTLYLGVDDSVVTAHDHFQVVADYDKPLGETNSIFMSFSMRGDHQRAPAGMRALTISTHTNLERWWRLRSTAGAQNLYMESVADYSERMLASAEQAVPGLRCHIKLKLAGTPVTFRTFTRRYRGGVGGFPFKSLFRTCGPWTGIDNAWLVGDSIFPGQSTAGVTMGALRVVDDVITAIASRR